MNCPKCNATKNLVIESRKRPEFTKRRRECSACGERWNTAEVTMEFYQTLLDARALVN